MFNFKDYIETDIEEKKEIINVMPTNTVARKKKYVETVSQIKKEYEGHKDSVKKFITYNYEKLLPHKNEVDCSKQKKKKEKIEQLIMLDNPLTDYYEKMKLNQCIYVLMHYYNHSISELNNTISKIIESFQNAGITLTKKDFKLNMYSYIYMEYFFDEYFVINDEYSLEHFQNVYWKCPNVFLYIVVNFRYIFKKYKHVLNRYIQKYLKNNLEEYQIKSVKDLQDNLLQVKKEILDLEEETEYDIVQLCLDKKIDINYYRKESNNIMADYDFFTIRPIKVENKEEQATFLESLKSLTKNLNEYQTYLKYQPIIEYFKKNYNPQEESKNKNELQEIKKIQKEIAKLENNTMWKNQIFPYKVPSDFLTQELNENQISKISEEDKKIKDIYKKYEEYDKLYYGYKIKSMIKKTSKVSDIFYLLLSYPIFARKIIKESLELTENEEIDDVLLELKELLYNPYKKVITMIPVFENNNIPQILMNGYRFENLNITEDSFEETNIKIIFERADKIFRELKINNFKLSIDQIDFLVNVYNMKKNNQI